MYLFRKIIAWYIFFQWSVFWNEKKDTLVKLKTIKMEEQHLQLQAEIEQLKTQLTGDLFGDMDIKDQIHNLEMKLNGVRPMDSHIDCVGCGS